MKPFNERIEVKKGETYHSETDTVEPIQILNSTQMYAAQEHLNMAQAQIDEAQQVLAECFRYFNLKESKE